MIFITQEDELQFNTKCIMYFYASWMPYHKKMMVMLDKMEEKYKLPFYAINVDNFKSLCKRFLITSVPSVLFFSPEGNKKISGLILTSALRSAFINFVGDKNEKRNSRNS
jgi:thiol-disulfide isomerase/thioredoxin